LGFFFPFSYFSNARGARISSFPGAISGHYLQLPIRVPRVEFDPSPPRSRREYLPHVIDYAFTFRSCPVTLTQNPIPLPPLPLEGPQLVIRTHRRTPLLRSSQLLFFRFSPILMSQLRGYDSYRRARFFPESFDNSHLFVATSRTNVYSAPTPVVFLGFDPPSLFFLSGFA